MYIMNELTEVDNLLLSTLDTERWHTRAEIAKLLPLPVNGEHRPLNQYEIKRLERLVTTGRVEKRQHPTYRVRKVFIYRLRGG